MIFVTGIYLLIDQFSDHLATGCYVLDGDNGIVLYQMNLIYHIADHAGVVGNDPDPVANGETVF